METRRTRRGHRRSPRRYGRMQPAAVALLGNPSIAHPSPSNRRSPRYLHRLSSAGQCRRTTGLSRPPLRTGLGGLFDDSITAEEMQWSIRYTARLVFKRIMRSSYSNGLLGGRCRLKLVNNVKLLTKRNKLKFLAFISNDLLYAIITLMDYSISVAHEWIRIFK